MKLLLLVFAFLFCSPVSSQKITGWVIDSESKIPLDNVTIAIIRKNKGTVSDKNGLFSVKLIPENNKDSLRISARGYQSVSFDVRDLKRVFQESKGKLIIELTRKNSILTRIALAPRTFEKEVIGNKGRFKPMTVKYKSITTQEYHLTNNKSLYRMNKEVGTIMKIKKSPALSRM